jgi:hypothetical protein
MWMVGIYRISVSLYIQSYEGMNIHDTVFWTVGTLGEGGRGEIGRLEGAD